MLPPKGLPVNDKISQSDYFCFSGPEDKEKPCTGQTARLLALLDYLAAHRACKVAVLHLINGGKGDERYNELFQKMLNIMKSAGDNIIHLQCAEYISSIVQYLCDQVWLSDHSLY